jgi:hypothetical protein
VRRVTPVILTLALTAGLALTATGTSAAAKVHVEPLVNFALPSTKAGCGGATPLPGGAERIPIKVSTMAGQVAEMVNVCIAGKGPYPFLIDSGAGESIIAASLATKLHLRRDGPTSEFAGVGCVGSAASVSVSLWSVAGVPLQAQTFSAATLPDFGTPGQPVGLFGSDIMSRFGAVRIDFKAQTLTLGGPEGTAVSGPELNGPIGPAPSSVLTEGEPSTTVPISVTRTQGDVALGVQLRVGTHKAKNFVIDTGSSQSVIGTSLAKVDHLAHTNLAQKQTTVCSTITVPLVKSGPWSIPGVILRPQLLGEAPGSIGGGGIGGLVGSDQLKHFGWVIFDYAGGRLVLG